MDKQTGGPAFPEHLAVTPMGDTYSGEAGMTLRDYFAAKALPSILAVDGDGIQAWAPTAKGVGGAVTAAEAWAKNAYQIADAMLAERSKP